MNKIASSILSLYSYDENHNDISLENVLRQSIFIIATTPIIAAQAYAIKQHINFCHSWLAHRIEETLTDGRIIHLGYKNILTIKNNYTAIDKR